MKLNCLIVAAYLWWQGGMRSAIGVKRSEGLRGTVPHFFHVKERRGRTEVVLVDYIPRKRKHRFNEPGDSVLAFDGVYRVRIYRLSAVATAETLREAYRDAFARRL